MARKFWVNTNRNATVTKAIKDIDTASLYKPISAVLSAIQRMP